MRSLFSMKNWRGFLASLLLLCLCASSASAGEWKLQGYFWSGKADSVQLSWLDLRNGNYRTRVLDAKRIFRNGQSVGANASGSDGPPNSASITATGLSLRGDAVTKNGLPGASASIGSSVCARFVWQRGMKYDYDETTGNSSQYADPSDNPPKYVYVREVGSIGADTNIRQADGNPTGYNFLNRWQGDYYKISGSGMEGLSLGNASRPDYDNVNSWTYGINRKTIIRKVAVTGDSLVVPSRTFQGEIKLSSGYEKEIFDQLATANLSFGYEAEPINFSLGASISGAINFTKDEPTDKVIDAFIGKGYRNDGVDENPLKVFWNGSASFDLQAFIGNNQPVFTSPIYNWSVGPSVYLPSSPEVTQDDKAKMLPDASVPHKDFHWDFGPATGGGFPKTSTVKVKITDSTGEAAEIGPAKVTINWHSPRQYKIVVSAHTKGGPCPNPIELDEVESLDQQTNRIKQSYRQTLATGSKGLVVGAAFIIAVPVVAVVAPAIGSAAEATEIAAVTNTARANLLRSIIFHSVVVGIMADTLAEKPVEVDYTIFRREMDSDEWVIVHKEREEHNPPGLIPIPEPTPTPEPTATPEPTPIPEITPNPTPGPNPNPEPNFPPVPTPTPNTGPAPQPTPGNPPTIDPESATPPPTPVPDGDVSDLPQETQDAIAAAEQEFGALPPDKGPNNGKVSSKGASSTRIQVSGFSDEYDPDNLVPKVLNRNHQFPNTGAFDRLVPGQFYASHAEKKAAEADDSVSIAVNREMCYDCQNYFRDRASDENKTFVIKDPTGTRIFNPDRSISVVRSGDGVFTFGKDVPVLRSDFQKNHWR